MRGFHRLRDLLLAAAVALLPATAAAECPPHQKLVDGRCVPDASGAAPPRTANPAGGLAADAAAEPRAPPRPDVRGAGGGGAPAPAAAPQLRPVRVYLRAANIPPKSVGAYGIVALRGRPTPASRARLLKVCQAFVTHLPRQDSLPGNVPLADQMVTIWPLDAPDADGAKADDCRFVIDHYDLYGGVSAIEDANRQGAKLTGRGPFLIGWSPSSARGLRDKVVLIYDMSAYESQDSFDQAFTFWQDRVISDPALWRNGWSWENVRLSVRDFFDTYGEAALKAITLVGQRK